jgi:hypothetical protein
MYSRDTRSASATATFSECDTWTPSVLATSCNATYPSVLKSASWIVPGRIIATFRFPCAPTKSMAPQATSDPTTSTASTRAIRPFMKAAPFL